MGSEEPSRYGGERYVHYREDLRLDAGLDVPKTWEKAASRVAPGQGRRMPAAGEVGEGFCLTGFLARTVFAGLDS